MLRPRSYEISAVEEKLLGSTAASSVEDRQKAEGGGATEFDMKHGRESSRRGWRR
jgi:hypothetical protein